MSRQLETFREKLEVFAAEHKQEIRKDPAFRKHFQVHIRYSDFPLRIQIWSFVKRPKQQFWSIGDLPTPNAPSM